MSGKKRSEQPSSSLPHALVLAFESNSPRPAHVRIINSFRCSIGRLGVKTVRHSLNVRVAVKVVERALEKSDVDVRQKDIVAQYEKLSKVLKLESADPCLLVSFVVVVVATTEISREVASRRDSDDIDILNRGKKKQEKKYPANFFSPWLLAALSAPQLGSFLQ